MQGDSVFDRLSHELSRDERREMLEKIESTLAVSEEPLYRRKKEDDAPVLMDREFRALPWWSRLWLMIRSLFTGTSRTRLTEEYCLRNLQRRIEKSAPGSFDFQRGLVGSAGYRDLKGLKESVRVFRGPLQRALNEEKTEFYAFLGKMLLGDVEEKLVSETWES